MGLRRRSRSINIGKFIKYLPTSDKLAFLGTAAPLFASILPWKETAQDGEVIGLMSVGFPVVAAAAIATAALCVRASKARTPINPVIAWLVQMGASSFAVIWCLIFIKLSWDTTQVHSGIGNVMMSTSSPSVGVFISLLASIVAMGGTLMGLRERS